MRRETNMTAAEVARSINHFQYFLQYFSQYFQQYFLQYFQQYFLQYTLQYILLYVLQHILNTLILLLKLPGRWINFLSLQCILKANSFHFQIHLFIHFHFPCINPLSLSTYSSTFTFLLFIHFHLILLPAW